MFLDASAVVAIIKGEPGFEGLLRQAQQSVSAPIYSPLSRFEAVVSLARNRPETNRAATPDQIEVAGQLVDRLYLQLDATCIDLTEPIGTAALTAAKTYGRAVGHQAALNLGDCFAYACAKEKRVGLLYKGDDFAQTDLG